MKILQINCVYDFGSTGRLVADLHHGLTAAGHTSAVLYGRGSKSSEPQIRRISGEVEAKVHSLCSRLWGVDFGFSPVATTRAIAFIRKYQPDVVHLHCLNGHFINVYHLVGFLKKQKIRTVLTLHAEIMHTAGCEHAVDCMKWKTGCHSCDKIRGTISRLFRDDAAHCYRLMKQAFEGFENLTVVGVSRWLTDRAALSPVLAGARFETIHNGVDTSVFRYVDPTPLRQQLGIPADQKIILHVTPNFNHPIKGGPYVPEAAKRMPEHRFIIVGFNGDPAILPGNVIPVSHTNSREQLAAYYSLADVTLLTSERETFSMVCAESLCCGTPIVGFKAGGPESFIPAEFSVFSDFGDIDGLCDGIDRMLTVSESKQAIAATAEKSLSKSQMNEQYLSIYQK